MRRSTAVQPPRQVNDRLSLRATAGPDPKRKLAAWESGHSTFDLSRAEGVGLKELLEGAALFNGFLPLNKNLRYL